MPQRGIDRDKLRAAIRKRGDEYVCYMLDDAIDLLPQSKLIMLVGQYLDVTTLRPDAKAKGTLLAEVQAFERASLKGEYYESFNVSSKNFLETSTGTRAWIAECRRLLGRCIEAKKVPPAEVRDALERIFGLLRHIDEGHDDVVFFADEGGSWQVGVDWAKVFPRWFACLAATAAPEEYAHQGAKGARLDIFVIYYAYAPPPACSPRWNTAAHRAARPQPRALLLWRRGLLHIPALAR